jgi:transcriptional regulator with XRE-family HTH domain
VAIEHIAQELVADVAKRRGFAVGQSAGGQVFLGGFELVVSFLGLHGGVECVLFVVRHERRAKDLTQRNKNAMKNLTQSKDFSARLDFAMKKRNLKQADLARKMQTAYSTVSRWLENSMPRDKTMKELADLLCVSQNWLADGVGEMEPVNYHHDVQSSLISEKPAIYRAIVQPVAEAAKNADALTLWERIAATADAVSRLPSAEMRLKIFDDLLVMVMEAKRKDEEKVNGS